MGPQGEWEPEAENWLRWARTPDHDAYWYYRDTFLNHVLPPASQRTIEIGCGEGRVSRDLLARGHHVTAVDTSLTLLAQAQNEDRRGVYLEADGAALPFCDRSFDLAVAYNSLQGVDDMAGTVREVARVLESGGRFCACVSHPITDVGAFVDDAPDAPFVVRGSYFERRRVDDRVERDGLKMRFQGWTYSLQDYSEALSAAGFQIEALAEPVPSRAGKYERWHRIPMFLLIKAIRGASS